MIKLKVGQIVEAIDGSKYEIEKGDLIESLKEGKKYKVGDYIFGVARNDDVEISVEIGRQFHICKIEKNGRIVDKMKFDTMSGIDSWLMDEGYAIEWESPILTTRLADFFGEEDDEDY